jgi:hypothetical protein
MLKHVGDEDDDIRATAVEALGRLGRQEAQAAIVQCRRESAVGKRLELGNNWWV